MKKRLLLLAAVAMVFALAVPQSGEAENPTTTVCHITDQDTQSGHIIRVNFGPLLGNENNALSVHISHGDFLNPEGPPGAPCGR